VPLRPFGLLQNIAATIRDISRIGVAPGSDDDLL
jgi:hypothetical protein